MTPFGEAVRKLRSERGISQKEMAAHLGVSAAYLSALEHGQRSEPSWELVQRIIGFFHIIWDEAEELQRLAALSRPKIVIDARNITPRSAVLANRLAESWPELGEEDLAAIEAILDNAGQDESG